MIGIFLLMLFLNNPAISGKSFQDELTQKKSSVLRLVGKKKMRSIEDFSARNEIYRITQLLAIKGIGQKTVKGLSELLGVRFKYVTDNGKCYK